MERMAIEYLANAFWQLPVLALGAWLLLKMCKPGPAAQHRVWLAVLALGLLLPLRGVIPSATANASGIWNAASAAPYSPAAASYPAAQSATAASLLPTNSHSSGHEATASEAPNRLSVIAAALSQSVHRVSVNAAMAQSIVGLWLALALWGLLRITLAWRAARRLVANSRSAVPDERRHAFLIECAERVRVSVPEIRESDAIAGPVIVGAANPVLLWPENFAATSNDEMRAALCHELAHIRRRDYGMNLLCEAAALPLRWHPAIHAVERRIRATREMACDAVAAQAMESEAVYADCLVRLARSIVGTAEAEPSLAAGFFNANVMEERVMRLIREKSTMSLRTKLARGAAGATAMLAAALVAATFHLTPAMAQEVPTPPPAPPQVVPVAPSAPAQITPVTPTPPAHVSAPAVPVVTPAPAKLSPSIPMAPAQPVALTPAIPVGTKVPATPPVPAISAVVPVPPAPFVLQQTPQPPTPATSPQTHISKPIVITNGQLRNLTPAERARIEKQLAEAQKKIAATQTKINSPEFRKQIEDAQAAALKAQTMFNSAEFQQRMADAQKQIAEATAKFNSPEFRKKIQAEIDAAAKVNSAEFQKQIGDAQTAALRAQTEMNSAEFQKQMADAQKQISEATARMNSPEFKKQMEDAARAAEKVNSAEFQKQMADAQKQIADALARMKADQQKGAPK
ncbi:MAG: M56 family metallopeptidase [Acidobacteriaceae bacterium]